MSPATWTSIGRSVPFIIVAILIDLAWLGAQSVTVTRVTDTLHVRAPEFRFLQGRVLTQLRDGRTARLFVLDKDRARRRDVEVAFIEGDNVALVGGVEAGEHVITDGAQYLEDGEQVAIAEPLADVRGSSHPSGLR